MGTKVSVIGLGYVGLPLAVEFGKKFQTIGYDLSENRIEELKVGFDCTEEVSKKDLSLSTKLNFSFNIDDIKDSNYYIIAVPTPIDKENNPDLSILLSASKMVASVLKVGDIVIYESTVYPGCTEEDCVPVLEKYSKLKYNKDFFCGYSPERINPGDKKRTLTKIIKVTSGSNPEISSKVDNLYKKIITAGTYKAESIKVAEAAKIIENCQRDINIAFVNELSILFNHMNIDTYKVLEAAQTKWNFLPFQPGLVGGHCIGVDPFYLTYKAKQLGYDSKIILSGRKLNNSMPKEVVNRILAQKSQKISKGLILGCTFKENCPDIRNSKIFDIFYLLNEKNIKVDISDPYASKEQVLKEYDVELQEFSNIPKKSYDFIIIAVSHEQFFDLDINCFAKNEKTIIFDLKNIYKDSGFLKL